MRIHKPPVLQTRHAIMSTEISGAPGIQFSSQSKKRDGTNKVIEYCRWWTNCLVYNILKMKIYKNSSFRLLDILVLEVLLVDLCQCILLKDSAVMNSREDPCKYPVNHQIYVRDKVDCSTFYVCYGSQSWKMKCHGTNTVYSVRHKVCVWRGSSLDDCPSDSAPPPIQYDNYETTSKPTIRFQITRHTWYDVEKYKITRLVPVLDSKENNTTRLELIREEMPNREYQTKNNIKTYEPRNPYLYLKKKYQKYYSYKWTIKTQAPPTKQPRETVSHNNSSILQSRRLVTEVRYPWVPRVYWTTQRKWQPLINTYSTTATPVITTIGSNNVIINEEDKLQYKLQWLWSLRGYSFDDYKRETESNKWLVSPSQTTTPHHVTSTTPVPILNTPDKITMYTLGPDAERRVTYQIKQLPWEAQTPPDEQYVNQRFPDKKSPKKLINPYSKFLPRFKPYVDTTATAMTEPVNTLPQGEVIPTFPTNNGSEILKSSEEELDTGDQCGVVISPFIIGGRPSLPGRWPWQVSLQIHSKTTTWHRCGGVLIHPLWVLTAAHCVEGDLYNEAKNWMVVMSDDDLSSESGQEIYRRVDTIVQHPAYFRTSNFPNDIALLKLDEEVDVNGDYVRLSCLPEEDDELDENEQCWISGWGETRGESSEETAGRLHELQMDILPNWLCASMWQRVGIHVLDDQVCAGYGNTGACYGDSGGPLMCEKNGVYYVAGVMSWLIHNCTARGFPNVFTRVTSYLDWIYDTVENEDWWKYY